MFPHTAGPGHSAAARSTGPLRWQTPRQFVLKALITPPLAVVMSTTTLASTVLQALSRPTGPRRLNHCAGCGGAVTATDPFLRYRGDYYHAHNCLESNPPAARHNPTRL